MQNIKIATRKSPLALWQAEFIKAQLQIHHPNLEVEIVGMSTKGDEILDRSLAKVGGKGLFLKELETSLLKGETDIAVHSMKDVPVVMPEGLEIAVVCERENPHDAFVSNTYEQLSQLKDGCVIGTSSLRRVAQLKAHFPHCEFKNCRGNVNTRLAKLDAGEYDAIILASAGLTRLKFLSRIRHDIETAVSLPAVGQGIVGVECRSNDERVKQLLAPLNDVPSQIVLSAERALNKVLDAGCSTPVAGFAQLNNQTLSMRAVVGDMAENRLIKVEKTISDLSQHQCQFSAAKQLGEDLAQQLIDLGADKILASYD